ncbi:MAG TPA: permease [Desulfuromonadaceae bacterium]
MNPIKPKEVCQVHGNHARSGNWMLIAMMLISLSFIVWHVWVNRAGSYPSIPGAESRAFPLLLGDELWNLLFNKKGILAELREILPYFLIGIFIAGYLRTYKIAQKLQATLKKYGVLSVFLASFVGIITPLCACGTLTTAISLLFAGIPLAPVMALMVTSPLLSPSTYLLTLNDLGPEWTAIRTISALAMGIFAGLVTHFLSKGDYFKKNDIFIEGAILRGDFHDDDYPDERLRCNCRRNFGNRVAVRTGNKFYVFLAKSAEMLWVVGKYVIVGVVIGAVVERYLPSAWIYRFFGQKDPLNIVWITLASVPMFIHQISASSILYHIKGSLNGTLDNGAALAFMIGGPVTAVPTMVLFWTFFKKRVFFLYMFVCLSGTILISYAFQFLIFVPGVDLGNSLLNGIGSLAGGASSIIEKHDPKVRMIMDPGGKGIIATYTNDAEGVGPIVFDASPGRFTTDHYDNRNYILNIAEWLSQNSTAHKNILVYNLSEPDPGGLSPFLGDTLLARLGNQGFKVRLADRKIIPRLTERNLDGYDQLWLFFGSPGANALNDMELKVIRGYNTKGGAALIVPDAIHSHGDDVQEANRLSSGYGVRFKGFVKNNQELRVSSTSNILQRTAEWLGSFLKLVKKA